MKTYLLVAAALAAMIVLAAACGGDSPEVPTPAPTATPEPTPTATPVPPTPTPVPPTPTAIPPTSTPGEEPASRKSLENLQLTPSTLGSDLVDALSEEEVSCIKAAVGDQIFGLMLSSPIMQASANPAAAAPIFACLTIESIVYFGVAMFDAQAGGWEPESRRCIAQLGLEHPEAIFVQMGLDWEGEETSAASETNVYNLAIYDCLTDAEKQKFTLDIWTGLDRNSTLTGQDIFDLLLESEAACVQQGLPEDEFEVMVSSTPLEAVAIGSTVAECISPESTLQIFVTGMEGIIGDLTEESAGCFLSFASSNPAYVALLARGLESAWNMSAAEFVEVTDVGVESYDCLTDEELRKVQEAVTKSLGR